jgi:hypothetical protein
VSISSLEERQQMGGRRLSRDGDKSTRDSLVYVLPNERLLIDRLRWAADLSPDVPSRAPAPPKIKRGFIALGAGLGLASGLGACLAAGPYTIAACALLGAAAGAGSNYAAQRAQGAK